MTYRLTRMAIATAAAAAAAVFAHWALTRPDLIAVPQMPGPVTVKLFLGPTGRLEALPDWFRYLSLGLLALLGFAASALSLFILFKSTLTPATRRLAAALALAPLSTAYFFFISTHGVYRQPLGLDAHPATGWALSFLAYAAGLASLVLLVRFFIGYPRQPTLEEMAAFRAKMRGEAIADVRGGWRKRFYGPLTRFLDRRAASRPAAFAASFLRPGPSSWDMMQWRFFTSGAPLVAALLLATFATAMEAYGDAILASATRGTPQFRAGMRFGLLPWVLNFVFMVVAFTAAFQALQYHHREAIADDRARIDWIYGTLLVAGLLALAIQPIGWGLSALILPTLAPGGFPGELLLFGPGLLGVLLFFAAFLASIALSIFYRGAVDPRLAVRRLTIFGVMGLVVAVVFVVIERAVAIKVASWLGLPSETGALIAAALVAGTLGPLRTSAERSITRLVSRYLPLDALVEGERKTVAVVLSDLSGYTALSATDEKQAMLVAALLQRQAEKAAAEFRGRVVKSMGDAVILTFESAGSAARAMALMHSGFAAAAGVLGLPALPVHSGAHFGEVTQTHDGDIYGQTVNIAARLQSIAKSGQQVVSAEFARAAALEGSGVRSLGPQRLKNVPEPVDCLEVVTPA